MTSDFTVAVHGLVILRHRKKVCSSEYLAQNICTNSARVRKVMGQLKKAGMIDTKEGTEGGYFFPPDKENVTLRQVSDALHSSFVNCSWKSGNPNETCLISKGMTSVLDEVYQQMNDSCHSMLEGWTICDLENKLFGSLSA